MYAMQEGYLASNPYHNSLHGADVLQASYWLIFSSGKMKTMHNLSSVEVLSALIAAIIHDLGHPGIDW